VKPSPWYVKPPSLFSVRDSQGTGWQSEPEQHFTGYHECAKAEKVKLNINSVAKNILDISILYTIVAI
jgi:hypothetical protein